MLKLGEAEVIFAVNRDLHPLLPQHASWQAVLGQEEEKKEENLVLVPLKQLLIRPSVELTFTFCTMLWEFWKYLLILVYAWQVEKRKQC